MLLLCSVQLVAQDRPTSLPSTTPRDTNAAQLSTADQESSTMRAIPTPYIRYGVYAQASYNQHQPTFKDLISTPFGIPFSPVNSITGVDGLLGSAGGMFEFPLFSSFGVAIRAGYSSFGATFRSRETVPASIDNQPFELPIGYVAAAQLGTLDAQVLLWLRPLRYLSIYAGGTAGYTLQRRVRQYEESLDPNYVFVLPNGSQSSIRAEVYDNIPTFRSVPLWLTGGISYEIPLNAEGTMLLAPEVFYQFQLPTVSLFSLLQDPERAWRVNALRAGISLRFSPNPTNIAFPAETPRQKASSESVFVQNTTPASTQPPTAKILSVAGVSTDGRELSNPVLRIEEVTATKSRYILNAIFFDANSATIPTRYHTIAASERSRFKPDNLASLSDIDTYYHVLNIVGQRMSTRTKAKLTLVGMADASVEHNDKSLAIARAEAVKQYLVTVWGITASRISVLSRTTFQSDENDTQEMEEQRRVEMTSDVPEIFDELRFDYRGKVITPPTLRVRFDINAPAGVQSWKFEALQDDIPLKIVRGGSVYPQAFEWNLASAPLDSLPQGTQEIGLRLEVTDRNSRTVRSPYMYLPIELVSASTGRSGTRTDIYHVYSAMQGVSAYSNADASVQRQLVAIMRKGIRPGAKVAITGYVDSRTAGNNPRALTEQQAQNLAAQINFPDMIVAGGGIASFYTNTLPEGRLYNRFIQVEVKLPQR
ncbi:MAG: hypothetical protein RML40_03175 [Bacteroidota bacterium]|nr:hypothetical protein [Candidatus Kapabacteria bacterium]MDW8219512.1 hypothetical protein [Bacteroidota bacterium]